MDKIWDEKNEWSRRTDKSTQNWQKSNAKNKKQQKTIDFFIVILVIFRL